jgi:hypothetical protein
MTGTGFPDFAVGKIRNFFCFFLKFPCRFFDPRAYIRVRGENGSPEKDLPFSGNFVRIFPEFLPGFFWIFRPGFPTNFFRRSGTFSGRPSSYIQRSGTCVTVQPPRRYGKRHHRHGQRGPRTHRHHLSALDGGPLRPGLRRLPSVH